MFPIVHLVGFGLGSLFIIITFYKSILKGRLQHTTKLNSLKEEYLKHQLQIARRDTNLNLYDFKKYNIKAALIPQYQIEV